MQMFFNKYQFIFEKGVLRAWLLSKYSLYKLHSYYFMYVCK